MFEAFVERESGTLLGFFRRLGAAVEEAEDLTQDVLVKLFRAAPTYSQRERFPAYAFRVARNAWIDAERGRSVRPAAAAGSEPDEATPEQRRPGHEREPEEVVAIAEERSRLDESLASLPEGHRLVFELGAIQELDYAEIGGILDIPVGTVKSRMFHAVRKLRRSLGGSDQGESS